MNILACLLVLLSLSVHAQEKRQLTPEEAKSKIDELRKQQGVKKYEGHAGIGKLHELGFTVSRGWRHQDEDRARIPVDELTAPGLGRFYTVFSDAKGKKFTGVIKNVTVIEKPEGSYYIRLESTAGEHATWILDPNRGMAEYSSITPDGMMESKSAPYVHPSVTYFPPGYNDVEVNYDSDRKKLKVTTHHEKYPVETIGDVADLGGQTTVHVINRTYLLIRDWSDRRIYYPAEHTERVAAAGLLVNLEQFNSLAVSELVVAGKCTTTDCEIQYHYFGPKLLKGKLIGDYNLIVGYLLSSMFEADIEASKDGKSRQGGKYLQGPDGKKIIYNPQYQDGRAVVISQKDWPNLTHLRLRRPHLIEVTQKNGKTYQLNLAAKEGAFSYQEVAPKQEKRGEPRITKRPLNSQDNKR